MPNPAMNRSVLLMQEDLKAFERRVTKTVEYLGISES